MTITLEEQFERRPVDPAELERLKDEMRQYARAYRLREVREAQAMTQVEVAAGLGIGQNRVSQIERGDIGRSRIDTLRRYVEALGGRLSVQAEFGDARYVIAG